MTIIISSIPYPDFTPGEVASSAQVNADFAAIQMQVNANAAHNGVNTDITALEGLTSPLAGAASLIFTYAGVATTSDNNNLVISTTNPTGFTLVPGTRITFLAPGTNTGAMALAVNGQPNTALLKQAYGGPVAMAGYEFFAGQMVDAWYDGTHFQTASAFNDPHAVGELKNFGFSAIPARWITFGNTLSRTGYSRLFAVIGTTWGVGDGSTTFGVPPAGYFERSLGGVNPNAFASSTADSFASHTHTYSNTQAGSGGSLAGGTGFSNTGGQVTSATGGAETAPKHMTVLGCIYAGQ